MLFPNHNIFESSVCCGTPSSTFNAFQHSREEDYVQLTPISPIKISFAMDEQTPQTEVEPLTPNNDQKEPTSNSVVDQFIQLLKSDSDVVKFEAASSLVHMLTSENVVAVTESDGLSCVVGGLESKKQSIRDECAKCLSKIASFSHSHRDTVILNDGLISLLRHVNSSMSDLSYRIFIEAISVFCSCDTRPLQDVCATLIPQLAGLLQKESDERVVDEVSKVIIYLCANNTLCIKAFIHHGTKTRLMYLLTHKSEVIIAASLRVLRCLVLPKVSLDQDRVNPSEEVEEAAISLPVSREANQNLVTSVKPNHVKLTKRDKAKGWSAIPMIDPTSSQASTNLCDLDLIICQNVEIFKATIDDANDREKEAGTAIVGQVGLRCIHCGLSPFARAQFSTVYPGSISLIAASLRHMANTHFRSCERTPLESRRRMDQIINDRIEEQDTDTLKNFCSELCMRTGIVNRYPQRSGLTVAEFNNTFVHNEQKTTIVPNSYTSSPLDHPLCHKTDPIFDVVHEGYTKTPNRPLLQVRNESDYAKSHPREHLGARIKFEGATESSIIPSYFRDQNGLWRCRHCTFAEHIPTVQHSTWEGEDAPPISFAKKHSLYCPQIRAQNFWGQLNTTHHLKPIGQLYCNKKKAAPIGGSDMTSIYTNANDKLSQVNIPSGYESRSKLAEHEKRNSAESPHECRLHDGHHFNEEKVAIIDDQSTISDIVNSDESKVDNNFCSSTTEDNKGTQSHNPKEKTVSSPIKDKCTYQKQHEEGTIICDLLLPEDKQHLTDYTITVMGLMKRCFFVNEVDGRRRGSLSIPSFPEGFPGIQCVYCVDGKHPRKFFFSKSERLVNSFSEISLHLMKCKYCPPAVKIKLDSLKKLRQDQHKSLPRGAQALYFRRMWTRLHTKVTSEEPSRKVTKEDNDHSLSSSTVLRLGHSDDIHWLSDIESLARQNIEVFCATEKDLMDHKVTKPKFDLTIGRVGLRCLHCVKSNQVRDGRSSVCYPQSIERIRDCVRELHANHFPYCNLLPRETKVKLTTSKISGFRFKLVREYYISSAKNLGLYDSRSGVLLHQPRKPTQQNPLSLSSSFDGMLPHSSSSSFEDFLPKPPLDFYLEDEQTRTDRTRHEEISSNNNDLQLERIGNALPSSSSANTVTPCTAELKRKHDDITQDTSIEYQNTDNNPAKRYNV